MDRQTCRIPCERATFDIEDILEAGLLQFLARLGATLAGPTDGVNGWVVAVQLAPQIFRIELVQRDVAGWSGMDFLKLNRRADVDQCMGRTII